MNYKGYTYKELLQDDFFLESQLTPTDESIRFWDTIIKNDEALASEINRAQEIICRIPFWITVSAAASIALFCILGWTYYSDFYSNDNLMAIEEVAKPTQFPSEVQLIRSNNNEMTIQGEESVIQYDEKGTLSINSEKVATKENDKPEKKQYMGKCQ